MFTGLSRMNKSWIICIILLGILSSAELAHSSELPRLKNGEPYAKVRAKMLRAGWKPYHAFYADSCSEEDVRCKGRPEMITCSVYGDGGCSFLWTKNESRTCIETMGAEDDTFYTGKCLWPMSVPDLDYKSQDNDSKIAPSQPPKTNRKKTPDVGSDEYWVDRKAIYAKPFNERGGPDDPIRSITPEEYRKGNIGHTEYAF